MFREGTDVEAPPLIKMLVWKNKKWCSWVLVLEHSGYRYTGSSIRGLFICDNNDIYLLFWALLNIQILLNHHFRTTGRNGSLYLVKWKELTYTGATWETLDSDCGLKVGKNKFKNILNLRKMGPRKLFIIFDGRPRHQNGPGKGVSWLHNSNH